RRPRNSRAKALLTSPTRQQGNTHPLLARFGVARFKVRKTEEKERQSFRRSCGWLQRGYTTNLVGHLARWKLCRYDFPQSTPWCPVVPPPHQAVYFPRILRLPHDPYLLLSPRPHVGLAGGCPATLRASSSGRHWPLPLSAALGQGGLDGAATRGAA